MSHSLTRQTIRRFNVSNFSHCITHLIVPHHILLVAVLSFCTFLSSLFCSLVLFFLISLGHVSFFRLLFDLLFFSSFHFPYFQSLKGFEVARLTPLQGSGPSPMGLRTQTLHPILTAETHNFPTYVCRMISRYADGYAYIFLHNSIHFLLLLTCFVISSLCLLSLCLLFFFF